MVAFLKRLLGHKEIETKTPEKVTVWSVAVKNDDGEMRYCEIFKIALEHYLYIKKNDDLDRTDMPEIPERSIWWVASELEKMLPITDVDMEDAALENFNDALTLYINRVNCQDKRAYRTDKENPHLPRYKLTRIK